MIITELYTGQDKKSHFKMYKPLPGKMEKLGFYSLPYAVKLLMFREFEGGAVFDWHNAPQPQYIIYLDGEVEVEASGGEKHIFKSGDILFANDLEGEGHVTRTITKGKSIIVTAAQFDKIEKVSWDSSELSVTSQLQGVR